MGHGSEPKERFRRRKWNPIGEITRQKSHGRNVLQINPRAEVLPASTAGRLLCQLEVPNSTQECTTVMDSPSYLIADGRSARPKSQIVVVQLHGDFYLAFANACRVLTLIAAQHLGGSDQLLGLPER